MFPPPWYVIVFPPQVTDRVEVECPKFDGVEFDDLRFRTPVEN